MLVAVILSMLMGGAVYLYKLIKPPPSRRCGSLNGPPVTSPRIRLSDGRYLAYKVRGATKANAKYKVILSHGFFASKDTYIPLSDEWLQELSIFLVTFDRAGHSESDPNPDRSPKSDALDIEELADYLKLGKKFYVVSLSMGSYFAWGCLKYIPHRLAGVAFVVPVVNYWWPSLPSELSSKVFNKLPLMERWRLRLIHYAPKFAWLLQQRLPLPTIDLILKENPKIFNKSDLAIMKLLSELPSSDKGKVEQQGIYESMFRDFVVAFGSWEFDPLEMPNPFPQTNSSVHLWIGDEDGMVSRELLQHVAKRLPWIRAHQVPDAGHLIIHDKNICQMIFKSLVLGDNPSLE
ncbi:unnamed protein product [Amaranthus hypochondriacus]